jgi:hypothetical protein
MALLATIELTEKTVCGREKIFVVGKVVRRLSHAASEFRDDLGPIVLGKRFELFDQFLRGLRHKTRVPRCLLEVKFTVSRPNVLALTRAGCGA